MKYGAFVALLFVTPLWANGKPEIPLVSVESRLLPSLDLKDPIHGTFEDHASVDISNFKVEAALPFRTKIKDATLTATMSYEAMHVDYHHWNEAQDPTTADNLYALELSFSLRRKMRHPAWSFSSFLTPGLNSDFKAVTVDALRLQGGVFFNRTGGRGMWTLGIVMINDYGSPRVYPALGYGGKITEKQSIMIRAPILLAWQYEFNPKVQSGLAARVSGNNFQIEEKGIYHDHNVRYSVASVGPFLTWKISPAWILSMESGWVVHHDLEYRRNKHKVRDLDFAESGVVSIGVKFIR